MTIERDTKIAVIGLGYVGLPLAVEFSKKFDVVGFDISARRIEELTRGFDRTREVADQDLFGAKNLRFTADEQDIGCATVFIVTAPTPVDEFKEPDLGPVLAASHSVGNVLKRGDTVIFESTVYPGATEERCVPVLEKASGLVFNTDFAVGYSPERINPGDQEHRLPQIAKVTSGSNEQAAAFIDELYGEIIVAGTFKASSIRVAEAAKVIENTQRDVNIALVNELALLFDRLDIDTADVLEAAGTKWNFLRFQPGLVGGHCIGVDPYYLTYKARSVGFHAEMILAGRRINDSMGSHIASETVKLLAKNGIPVNGARVLIVGLTFKENTPDLRNTRVVDVIDELTDYGVVTDVYDPWVSKDEAKTAFDLDLVESPGKAMYDGVVLAVAHDEILNADLGWISQVLRSENGVVFDLKSRLPRELVTKRL